MYILSSLHFYHIPQPFETHENKSGFHLSLSLLNCLYGPKVFLLLGFLIVSQEQKINNI